MKEFTVIKFNSQVYCVRESYVILHTAKEELVI